MEEIINLTGNSTKFVYEFWLITIDQEIVRHSTLELSFPLSFIIGQYINLQDYDSNLASNDMYCWINVVDTHIRKENNMTTIKSIIQLSSK